MVTLGVERWESHEVKRAADGTATVEVAGLGLYLGSGEHGNETGARDG